MQEETIYSYHTFMFPFRWRSQEKSSTIGDFISNQTHWKEQENIAETKDTSTLLRNYNEMSYFYNFTHNSLYQQKGSTSKQYYYQYVDGVYIIEIKEQKKFSLKVEKILLKLYETGVGIVSFHLNNIDPRQHCVETVLQINDYGRRLYPQFLSISEKGFTYNTEKSFYPSKVLLQLDEKTYTSSISDYQNTESIKKILYKKRHALPSYIVDLLIDTNSDIEIQPVTDDRMYTLCWLGDDKLSAEIRSSGNKQPHLKNKYWYRLIFNDGNMMNCQNIPMRQQLIKEHTYARWSDFGSIIGMSRNSFIMLTDGSEYSQTILAPHIRTMYFQIASMLLSTEATILHFSDEVNKISLSLDREDVILQNTKRLYKNYLKFINSIWFREVTAQDQGQEVYKQALKISDMPAHIDALHKEIEEVHRYAQMLHSERESEKLNHLNKLAGWLLPASVISGILGMNILPKSAVTSNGWLPLFFMSIFTLLVTIAIVSYKSKKVEP